MLTNRWMTGSFCLQPAPLSAWSSLHWVCSDRLRCHSRCCRQSQRLRERLLCRIPPGIVCLKNTEFHSELVQPAGTRRYWFSHRVKRAGRKRQHPDQEEMKRYTRAAAACELTKEQLNGKKRRKKKHIWNFISAISFGNFVVGTYFLLLRLISNSNPFFLPEKI